MCAGRGGLERTNALPPESRQLFEQYKQFMTELQVDRFLDLTSDDARKQFITDLKVQDLLSQFPPVVQQAIWDQKILLGMNKAAVLLSWGSPFQRDFDDDQSGHGNTVDRWLYKRHDKKMYVTFTNDVVSDYDDGAGK